jgi:hypothetical protein
MAHGRAFRVSPWGRGPVRLFQPHLEANVTAPRSGVKTCSVSRNEGGTYLACMSAGGGTLRMSPESLSSVAECGRLVDLGVDKSWRGWPSRLRWPLVTAMSRTIQLSGLIV